MAKALGEYVKKRRGFRSVADMVSASGVSDTTWTKVEKAGGPLSPRTLILVARALGEQPNTLLRLAGLPTEEGPEDEPSSSPPGSPVSPQGLREKAEQVRVLAEELLRQLRQLDEESSAHHAGPPAQFGELRPLQPALPGTERTGTRDTRTG